MRMFEKRMPRTIAQRKEQEDRETVRSEEHQYLYSSADIFIVIKLSNMRLVGRVACICGRLKMPTTL
jgi:hypothetical protein